MLNLRTGRVVAKARPRRDRAAFSGSEERSSRIWRQAAYSRYAVLINCKTPLARSPSAEHTQRHRINALLHDFAGRYLSNS
ncbi:hypothetical protein KCP75_20815 [Salmonella enterica subsp. enterica]|nr:hypothetical protein KCP75_20815 [Salmonella enterica subsp. enterica]